MTVRLEVGPVAAGGHCVARHEGRVVFVRHALPGELVLARITDGGPGRRFWRADAVEVIRASPDRRPPPCPMAGPGRCGGCDWQHVTPAAQRRLKADVVVEQLRRLAGIDLRRAGLPDLVVEELPGAPSGLGWRTRVGFAVDAAGRIGFHPHRSHAVLPVPSCPIAAPGVNAVGVAQHLFPGASRVDVAVPSDGGEPLVVVDGPAAAAVGLPPGAAVARRTADGVDRVRGRTWLRETVQVDGVARAFRVTGGGFWQVHTGAAQTLLDAVLGAATPAPGERALDLFSGVGLFAAGLASRVGAGGAVVAVEADPRAAADARRSLHDLPTVRVVPGSAGGVLDEVTSPSGPLGGSPDVVVLDPPRAGAGQDLMARLTRTGPRVVVYVSCDPASLARDLGTALTGGYRLSALRAFDAFPMTAHVECVATLVPG